MNVSPIPSLVDESVHRKTLDLQIPRSIPELDVSFLQSEEIESADTSTEFERKTGPIHLNRARLTDK